VFFNPYKRRSGSVSLKYLDFLGVTFGLPGSADPNESGSKTLAGRGARNYRNLNHIER
jgi:hypothetical protein